MIPCTRNDALRRRIEDFAETIKTQAHLLGDHGLDETEFYQSGILRGAVERIRGQYSAARAEKRQFIRRILNHLQDNGHVQDYEEAAGGTRYDFLVRMVTGATAAVSVKGCLDGNNTNVFQRPPEVDEFVIWSICTSPGADPRLNAWSGIHTRLSTEIILRHQQVDAVVIWDWRCGTMGRPCPKLARHQEEGIRLTEVGPWRLTPPCIYLMPSAIPSEKEPAPVPRSLQQVPLISALHQSFMGRHEELNEVRIQWYRLGNEPARRTIIERGGKIVHASEPTVLRRN